MLERMVGVVPAAGVARRLGAPASSKEIEPVYRSPTGGILPVAYRLLHAFAEAGITKAHVVTSAEKEDVRERLGAGDAGTPSVEHLVVESSPASAYTVSIGTQAAGESPVALGFPDVLWTAENAFGRLASRLEATGAAVVLGLFPPTEDYPTDGVAVAGGGRVSGFEPAASAGGLSTWTLAVWRPSFSRFLEREVALRYGPWSGATPSGELAMTPVLALALEAGMEIAALQVSDRPFLDIGEPGRLEAARAACRPANESGGSAPT